MAKKTFALLIKDHDKVKGIIDELLASSASAKKRRQELLLSLKQELQVHERLEEDVVYPVLEHKKATHDLALEAYQEHHVVDVLLEELDGLEFKDEAWKAKLTVLQENLLHHIDEEEQELFPEAQKNLSQHQLDQIERKIADAKGADRG